jgi:sulfite reductase alpha subunit-like flavoprotein
MHGNSVPWATNPEVSWPGKNPPYAAAMCISSSKIDMIDTLYVLFIWIVKALWLAVAAVFAFRLSSRQPLTTAKKDPIEESKVTSTCCQPDSQSCACQGGSLANDDKQQVLILHGSMKGTSKKFAVELGQLLSQHGSLSEEAAQVHCLSGYDAESILALPRNTILLIVISTYENGFPPLPARLFVSSLEEAANDFRVGRSALEGLRYSIFGCGNSLYEANFNTVAKKVDAHLGKDGLGAKLLTPVELGDEERWELMRLVRS